MKTRRLTLLLLSVLILFWALGQDIEPEVILDPGLQGRVEILRDPWGISHIFAETEADLFFAQGFNAARDRLFQLEVWRRLSTGSVAEVLGEDAVQQDIGARLLRFRGDLSEELLHYHPRGPQIIQSFVNGINAYLDRFKRSPELLPLEFRLLGMRPERWTPEVVISRHNGLFRNAGSEIELGRLALHLGAEGLSELLNLEPGNHSLKVPERLDLSLLDESILALYRASRSRFAPDAGDILDPSWRAEETSGMLHPQPNGHWSRFVNLGSNNWAISPSRTVTGYPLLANDPHRSLQVPSLRYFVHLVGPGWNVIGGGEPALPGISIGHNEIGAWGLTIFAIDQEDLYVYETDSEKPLRYRYGDGWEEMREVEETIRVKGAAPTTVQLRFTRHGPVLHEDPVNRKAYALRAAWLEKGTSPYLASLRFDQAASWHEFREACHFFLAPSENMIWADREGNIGWQATGITPIRPNWDGLLPVPGDGQFEWGGFLAASQLPSSVNPPEGFVATANQENLPPGYPFLVGRQWSEPFRYARIREFLGSGRLFSVADMVALQQDHVSLPARWLVPLLSGLDAPDIRTREAIHLLGEWDFVLRGDSAAAALYMLWERELLQRVWKLKLTDDLLEEMSRKSLEKTIAWLMAPDAGFGKEPIKARNQMLLDGLSAAVRELEERFGTQPDGWRWGDARLHHAAVEHLVSPAVRESGRKLLNVGPVARGGSSTTVNMTNSSDNQTSGASFRVIFDLEDWDRSLATNMPGQSGDPASPHYRDLVLPWSKGEYFPLLFSRRKIEAVATSSIVLLPDP